MSAEQDREMATILLRLELISHGAIVNYNPSGGQSGEPDDKMVAIVLRGEEYPHLTFRRRYRGCVTDKDRGAVIADAQKELDVWAKPRDWKAQKDAPSITQDQVVLADGEGVDSETLARRFLMTARHVRKVREKAGLDPETGRSPAEKALETAEKVQRVHELRAKGLTVRQIALNLQIGTGSVSRYLQNPSFHSVD